MTDIDGWEQQPGGLWLKVSPFDRDDPEQQEIAAAVMRGSIETVARAHGAAFNEKGLRDNMQAVYDGDLTVDFYLAKWDICERKPICIGANFGWDTYSFTPDGQLVRAFYTEDLALLRNQLRQLIQTKPKDKRFPRESLAACLERINLQMMQKDGVAYRYGEVDPGNTTMMDQLGLNGAAMETGADSAVLEYKRLPESLLDRFPMDAKVIPILRNGRSSENHFYVQWKEDSHDIRFVLTKGRATALGKPRADIRPWHNGNLPDQGILECVIASSLAAMKDEIEEERKWGSDKKQSAPSPALPLLEPKPRIFLALYDAAGNEIATSSATRPITFARPMPDAHVFVQSDQNMLDGFLAVGASRRLFGNKFTVPGVNVLHASKQLIA